jgi:hypothetical protein
MAVLRFELRKQTARSGTGLKSSIDGVSQRVKSLQASNLGETCKPIMLRTRGFRNKLSEEDA